MKMLRPSSGRSGFDPTTPGPPAATSSARTTTAEGLNRHVGITCDQCGQDPLLGVRYRCSVCPDFDLCEACIASPSDAIHGDGGYHLFLRILLTDEEMQRRPQVRRRDGLVHEGHFCDACPAPRANRLGIVGTRYMCVQCQVQLCEACEATGRHDAGHPRIKYGMPVPVASAAAGVPLGQSDDRAGSDATVGTLPPPAWSECCSLAPLDRPVASVYDLSPDDVKALLRREEALRLSPETQACFAAYRLAGRGEEGMGVVVEQVQERVAWEFRVPAAVAKEAMRCAEALLPGDQEVPKLSLYRRFNRCEDGPLRHGSAAPDALLVPVCPAAHAVAARLRPAGDLVSDPVSVHDLLSDVASEGRGVQPMPLILVAGSYT